MIETPNSEFNVAIISNVQIDNSFCPKLSELNEILNLPNEQIFVWTHTDNEYSKLVSKVNLDVKNKNYWKTFGVIFKQTRALTTHFEDIVEPNYHWIKDFNPTSKPYDLVHAEAERYQNDEFNFKFEVDQIFKTGNIFNLNFLYENADIITSLVNNDKFFWSVQHLLSSFENHWYCHACELSPPHLRKHLSHDFDKHNEVLVLPRLEIAIIQAVKAIEGILGQPGSNTERRIERWKNSLSIPFDAEFRDTGKSNLAYHVYLVNELRNKVAHNIRNKPFKFNRTKTINAQYYAWMIINDYYRKNLMTSTNGIELLNFNPDLLKRINPDLGTRVTTVLRDGAAFKAGAGRISFEGG